MDILNTLNKVKMKRYFGLLIMALILVSCGENKNEKQEVELSPIIKKAIGDVDSPFYGNFSQFPNEKRILPIGVFDSGTGGLTVLEVLLKADMVNNISGELGPDGIPDFSGEHFTYLADRANMPYGNYAAENKQDFFKELVVKDALFLLGDKYYENPMDKKPLGSKAQSKILVIACNTATAWGLEDVGTLLNESKTGVKVIGVINAGVNALLDKIAKTNSVEKEDSLAVGVLATVGTISSGAYERTIMQESKAKGHKEFIKVVNIPCVGFAEAVDREKDFVNVELTSPRESYRGPVLGQNEGDIKMSLLPAYSFEYNDGAILREKDASGNYKAFQLNSAQNYARLHLVNLVEKHRQSGAKVPLKYVILGCTHYPFMIETLQQTIEQLRHYKNSNGEYVYAGLIAKDFEFIDPAVYTALECYQTLRQDNQLALNPGKGKLDAYISVPVYGLAPDCIDDDGNLTYNFKYGREYGTDEITTVFVPFSRRYLDEATLGRIESMLPKSYEKIKQILE
jgi:glutamate racemase